MIEPHLIIFLLSLIIISSLFIVEYSNTLRLIEKLMLITLIITALILSIVPWLKEIIFSIISVGSTKELLIILYIPASLWGLVRSHLRLNKLNARINKLISESAMNKPIQRKAKHVSDVD